MGRLPPESEQAWLLDSLGELLLRHGGREFLTAPLRLATESDFPDAWDGDLTSLRRLCLRILGYCGMGGYTVAVDVFEGEREVASVQATGEANYRHQGAAAWFAGIDGHTVHFGCSDRQLSEAGEGLVGVMAHEVAHAWRTAHGLVNPDRDTEEHLTDLTTVVLGFGVFTVNNTYRYRASGEGLGSGYQISQAGYLSPEAMSYLFAAQIVSRELTCWQTRRLLGWLELRQRGHVKTALRALRPAADLRARLLPEPPAVALVSPNRPPLD